MMIKIAAGLIFYQDCKSLERCLNSLANFDLVICVDGRFSHFVGESELSTDGSRELVQQYSNTLLIDAPGHEEPEKRNVYLNLAKDYDWLLAIDSDEFLKYQCWEYFISQLEDVNDSPFDIFGIRYEYNHLAHNDWTLYPRLFHRPYFMEYYKAHNIFRNRVSSTLYRSSDAATKSGGGGGLVDGLILAGDDLLRTYEHLEASHYYQVWLIEKEKAIHKMFNPLSK